MRITHIKRRGGFSLIEVLIAITLGALIVLAMTRLFVANRTSQAQITKVALTQEAARTALDFVGHAVRHAGYKGCNARAPMIAAIPGGWGAMATHDLRRPIEVGDAAWAESHFAVDADRIGNSDVLVVRFLDIHAPPMLAVTDASVTAEAPPDAAWPLRRGDLLLASDCTGAAAVRAETVAKGSGVVTITSDFSALTHPPRDPARLPATGRIGRIVTELYYVGPTRDGPEQALWREANGTAAELLRGLDEFRVTTSVVGANTSVRIAFHADVDGTTRRFTTAATVRNPI